MTMMAIHAAAVNNKVSSYHEFLTRYSKHAKIVYGFVEGKEDPCFYRGFIDLMIPDDWEVELWPAGCKDQVYRVYAGFDWRRFPKTRVCFFVDRDISDLIPEKLKKAANIYVTGGYSIENDVVKRATCKRVLSELCGFSYVDHAELDDVCKLFEQEYEAFLTAIIPVMAWILYWNRTGNRPNLKNCDMGDLFSIQNGHLLPIRTPNNAPSISHHLHKQCQVAMNSTVNISEFEEEFKKQDHYKRFVRGKYVFWFLVEFCITVHRDTVALFKNFSAPPKMHVSLSHSTGMALISPRSRIPATLREFMKSTFCAYIAIYEGKVA